MENQTSPLTILTLKMSSSTVQTDYTSSHLGRRFKQILFLDFGLDQFYCQLRMVGFKEASTYLQAIAVRSCTILRCKCALLTPTCGILRDRWIRILTEISAKKRHTSRFWPDNIFGTFSKLGPWKGASSWKQNTAATPVALQNSGFCADVVFTPRASSQALTRSFKSSKCLHGNLLSQEASLLEKTVHPFCLKGERSLVGA